MKQLRTVTSVLVILLCSATGAFAQATRTWVSGVGDDVNPCSRTAPCKTFAGAISKTAAGGEIDALDDGGFGTLTITKALTIDGGGHLASALSSGVNGLVITAGVSDVVTLRGLSINGAGTGLVGVKITAAKHVNIDNCMIFGFSSNGVENSSSATTVQINNTSIHNNGGTGIAILNGKATIFSTQVVGNYIGVQAGGTAVALLSNSNVSFNVTGLQSTGTGLLQITHNDVFENTTAWNISGGQIQTYVDNRIRGAGIGTLTPVVIGGNP